MLCVKRAEWTPADLKVVNKQNAQRLQYGTEALEYGTEALAWIDMWGSKSVTPRHILLPTYSVGGGEVSSGIGVSSPPDPTQSPRRTAMILPIFRSVDGERFVLLLQDAQSLGAVTTIDLSSESSPGLELLDATIEAAMRRFSTCHSGFFLNTIRGRGKSTSDLVLSLLPCVNLEESDWSLGVVFMDLSECICALTIADEWMAAHVAQQGAETRQSDASSTDLTDGGESMLDMNSFASLSGSGSGSVNISASGTTASTTSLHFVPLKRLTGLTELDPFSSSRMKWHGRFELDPMMQSAFSLPSLRRLLQSRMLDGTDQDQERRGAHGLSADEQAQYGALERQTLRTPSNLRGLRRLKVLPKSHNTLFKEFWKAVSESEGD